MTSIEFNNKIKKIVSSCPKIKKDNHYQYQVETPCGLWRFSLGWDGRIKVAHLHSRFENYNSDYFNVVFHGFGLNSHTNKWNHYFGNPEDLVDMFEEIVDNIKYLETEKETV